MAQRLARAFKLTFAKKYLIYDYKHSGSIQIKEQYSPGQLSLPCTLRAVFLSAKFFIMQNKVLKINLFGLCENAWFPWQPIMQIKNGDVPTKLLIS